MARSTTNKTITRSLSAALPGSAGAICTIPHRANALTRIERRESSGAHARRDECAGEVAKSRATGVHDPIRPGCPAAVLSEGRRTNDGVIPSAVTQTARAWGL